jgi:hypothetical protein
MRVAYDLHPCHVNQPPTGVFINRRGTWREPRRLLLWDPDAPDPNAPQTGEIYDT